jgi:hypothetical protein
MAADRILIDPWLTELAGDTDTSRATVWQGMDPFAQALLLKTVPEARRLPQNNRGRGRIASRSPP